MISLCMLLLSVSSKRMNGVHHMPTIQSEPYFKDVSPEMLLAPLYMTEL
jgi:hypothetical protein